MELPSRVRQLLISLFPPILSPSPLLSCSITNISLCLALSVLTRLSIPLSTVVPFVTPLALNTPSSMPPNEPSVSSKAQLPAWLAIEFLADSKNQEAEKEKSRELGQEAAVVRSLISLSLDYFDRD